MGKRLVLATRNRGKISEIKALVSGMGLDCLSMDDLDTLPEVVEDGQTFLDNALKKAKEISEATGLMAMADDSGLEVDALGGAPGVYSARFARPGASDQENNIKLLAEMEGVPRSKRTARFRCVIVVYHPSGRWIHADGTCEGEITFEPRGDHGFGYDPLFFLPGLGKTMAELSPDEKNAVSHRGKALVQLKERLPDFIREVEEA